MLQTRQTTLDSKEDTLQSIVKIYRQVSEGDDEENGQSNSKARPHLFQPRSKSDGSNDKGPTTVIIKRMLRCRLTNYFLMILYVIHYSLLMVVPLDQWQMAFINGEDWIISQICVRHCAEHKSTVFSVHFPAKVIVAATVCRQNIVFNRLTINVGGCSAKHLHHANNKNMH